MLSSTKQCWSASISWISTCGRINRNVSQDPDPSLHRQQLGYEMVWCRAGITHISDQNAKCNNRPNLDITRADALLLVSSYMNILWADLMLRLQRQAEWFLGLHCANILPFVPELRTLQWGQNTAVGPKHSLKLLAGAAEHNTNKWTQLLDIVMSSA